MAVGLVSLNSKAASAAAGATQNPSAAAANTSRQIDPFIPLLPGEYHRRSLTSADRRAVPAGPQTRVFGVQVFRISGGAIGGRSALNTGTPEYPSTLPVSDCRKTQRYDGTCRA